MELKRLVITEEAWKKAREKYIKETSYSNKKKKEE